MKSVYFLIAFSLFPVGRTLTAQNWLPMAQGYLPDGYRISAISPLGDNVVWAIASVNAPQPPIPANAKLWYLRTSNGGQTWMSGEITAVQNVISLDIVAVDSLTAWITTQDFGAGPGRALFATTDGGSNWTSKFAHRSAGVSLRRFDDGQHWMAQNRFYIARSSDGASGWVLDTLSGYEVDEFQTLYSGTNACSIAGDTLWSGTSKGRVLRFTNYGQEYEFFNTFLAGAQVSSVAFQDQLTGMLCSKLGGLVELEISLDGGATWVPISGPPVTVPILTWNITAIPGTPGAFVLASTVPALVAITKDYGQTWAVETVAIAGTLSLNAVAFTSPEHGWVGVRTIADETTPAIYKYNGSPLVPTIAPPLPGKWSVSPNPADDYIRINHYEDLTTTSPAPVHGMITDGAGRLVYAGILSENTLDISGLTSGVYFLRLENNRETAYSKFVKR